MNAKIGQINLNSRQLWRACYNVSGHIKTVTFSAADLMDAQVFVSRWEKLAGIDVLTFKPIGLSRFAEKPWSRTKSTA